MKPLSGIATRVPISVRIAGLIGTAFFLLSVVVGAYQYVQTGRSMRQDVDRQLYEAVTSLRLPLLRPDELADQEEEQHELFAARGGLQLVDRHGEVVASAGELDDLGAVISPERVKEVREGRQLLDTIDHPEEDGQLRLLAVVLDIDEPPQIELEDAANEPTDLVAVVAVSLTPVAEAQRDLLQIYGSAALLATVAAGLLGLAIARKALAPIARLTSDADQFKTSDLTKRLSEPARMDEVGRLARTLNDLLARLEGAVAREKAFTADASHELRTPLAILRTELDLARARATDPQLRGALDSALEECDGLSRLVEDLLVLARAEGAGLRMQPVDLGELVRSVMARFGKLADEKGVSLQAHGDAIVRADETSLQRAISNLVDNAVRHTPAGGRVQVDVEEDAGGARLRVLDTGEGVPGPHLDRLFERFYRPDGARTGGSAGLGLAIVASVAERHGGQVTAHNRSSGGLAVELRLP
jgi:heavy metal sensor kinase